jgi:hypothetical protein
VPQGLEFCFLDKARFGDSLLRVKVIKTFLPHFVSNPKDIKDLPKMHNFSYYFCVSLGICKQTFTRNLNSVPRDIEDIVCKPKKTCTINDLFWTILFQLCVGVCEKERESEREQMGKLWKNVFSLVNSSNFASFGGYFLCHKIEKRILVTHNLFSQIFAIKHPKDIEFII